MAQRDLIAFEETSENIHQNRYLVFDSKEERDEAIFTLLAESRGGYNYFVRFRDVHGPALIAGYADWAGSNIYVDW